MIYPSIHPSIDLSAFTHQLRRFPAGRVLTPGLHLILHLIYACAGSEQAAFNT
jgi:hypothetical protein